LGVVALAAAAVACGSDTSDNSTAGAADASAGSAERAQIVVTTNILGDVVAAAVGTQADVEVIMPLGSDPHDFSPSARQAESMENADLLIVNGAGFEEGMLDIIANVSDTGTPVFAFADEIDLLEFSGHDDHGEEHDEHSDEDHGDEDHGDEDHGDEDHGDEDHDEDHGDEDHGDEDHGDEDHDEEKHSDGDEGHGDEEHSDEEKHSDEDGDDHDHDHGSDDPHIWTDPTRIATAVEALEPAVAALAGVDAEELSASIEAYVTELSALDASMDEVLTPVPEQARVLITNHEVFAYFADRYDFEVVGAIVPSLTTNAEPSAADIEELAELIEAENIPAVFGETTQSTQLADALAGEVGGDIAVVELFSESLGEEGSGAETYLGMMQLNADLVAEALTP